MSSNSGLRARLERAAQPLDGSPARSYSVAPVAIGLRRTGPLDRPVDVAQALRRAGATMRLAHTALNRLATFGLAVIELPGDADLGALSVELETMHVSATRPQTIADPATFLAQVRERHGMSQREFSSTLGIDLKTLQNWEQGRNRPDAAVLTLIRMFDTNPGLVMNTLFEDAAFAGPTR